MAPYDDFLALEPRPMFRPLERVLPVAQTRDSGGVEIVLLFLEIYGDGFIATFRIFLFDEWSASDRFRSLEITLQATDDRGRRYALGPRRGVTSGAPNLDYRGTFSFGPGLDPAAQVLRLEIPDLHWSTLEGERRETVPDAVRRGPWAFSIPLFG